ncbi:hypothetical protein Btru_049317 [Bulinus truncatus]|nr:hypothetical protein Btru_049317 [Bulinus truncatus]
MSASSLRSSRNITPIENPDIMEFFEKVPDTMSGGLNIRADEEGTIVLDTGRYIENTNNRSPFSPPSRDRQDFSETQDSDQNRGGEDNHFMVNNPQKLLHVKSKAEDDSDDIYDFGYINARDNGSINAYDNGSINAHNNSSVNAHGNGSINAHDNGSINANGAGSIKAHGDSSKIAHEIGTVNAHADGYTDSFRENSDHSPKDTQRRVLNEQRNRGAAEGSTAARKPGSNKVDFKKHVQKHVHYSDEVVSDVISYSLPRYGETHSFKDTDNETDELRGARGYEIYDDDSPTRRVNKGDQNRSSRSLQRSSVQKLNTNQNLALDESYYERVSHREYDSNQNEDLNHEEDSSYEDDSDQEGESNEEDDSKDGGEPDKITDGEQSLEYSSTLTSGKDEDTNSHQTYKSEKQGIDFEDSVENSYFAMFKSSDDTVHDDIQGDKHSHGDNDGGDKETVKQGTETQRSPSISIDKKSAGDHIGLHDKHNDGDGDGGGTDIERINKGDNNIDYVDDRITVKADDQVNDRPEANAVDRLDDRGNDHLGLKEITGDYLAGHQDNSSGGHVGDPPTEGHLSTNLGHIHENEANVPQTDSPKTDEFSDDAGNVIIEKNDNNDGISSTGNDDEKAATGNDGSGAGVNHAKVHHDKENENDLVEALGTKHKLDHSSFKTDKSSTSAHSKSASVHAHHRAPAPHKPIEEMKAMERLKYAPYNEHLARAYSKQAPSPAGTHHQPGQHSGKQKKSKQRKLVAEHPPGSESKQAENRRKTEDSASLKKEKTPRTVSGKAPGLDRLKGAKKEKKNVPKRKEQATAVETKTSVCMSEIKTNDENMNYVKEPVLQNSVGIKQETVNRSEVKEETLGITETTLEVRTDVIVQASLLDNARLVKAEPDTNERDLKNDTRDEVLMDERIDDGENNNKNDKTLADDNPAEDKRAAVDAKMETDQDEVKNMTGKNKEDVPQNIAQDIPQGADKSSKNKTTTTLKQKEQAGAKTKGGENKNSGLRNWFGGNKKKNQGDNSSSKYTNSTTPRSARSINGIIITTEPPKNEKAKPEVSEVPAALTVVDETKADPHGKAGRLVLANIKQKLKDSSLTGSMNSSSALPINQRSRSPSPETSFSSNGSKLGKMAHKTQSMSSLQVPGAGVTTPRDSGQDEDNISLSSRRDSGSRRSIDYRIQNATATIVPEVTDEKPKSVLTNEETFIKNAIPYMPLSLAVVCLILNIIIPGSGTALSGLSILCCGQARVSNKNDQILTTLCANCMVGLAQLFTVTFLLVGWFWSIGWGIQMVSLSVQRRDEMKKQRAKELQALALSAFGSPKRGAPFGP